MGAIFGRALEEANTIPASNNAEFQELVRDLGREALADTLHGCSTTAIARSAIRRRIRRRLRIYIHPSGGSDGRQSMAL